MMTWNLTAFRNEHGIIHVKKNDKEADFQIQIYLLLI